MNKISLNPNDIIGKIFTNSHNEQYEIIKLFTELNAKGKEMCKCIIKFLESGNEYNVFTSNALATKVTDNKSRIKKVTN